MMLVPIIAMIAMIATSEQNMIFFFLSKGFFLLP